jgi:hypothetical protein
MDLARLAFLADILSLCPGFGEGVQTALACDVAVSGDH